MSDKAMRDLCRIMAAMRRPRELDDFLRALLTPAERARLAVRWRLVRLLAAGMRQRDIVAMLRVSLCNITRGSRELKHGPACFRRQVLRSLRRGKL